MVGSLLLPNTFFVAVDASKISGGGLRDALHEAQQRFCLSTHRNATDIKISIKRNASNSSNNANDSNSSSNYNASSNASSNSIGSNSADLFAFLRDGSPVLLEEIQKSRYEGCCACVLVTNIEKLYSLDHKLDWQDLCSLMNMTTPTFVVAAGQSDNVDLFANKSLAASHELERRFGCCMDTLQPTIRIDSSVLQLGTHVDA
jgi:hypothetical protein